VRAPQKRHYSTYGSTCGVLEKKESIQKVIDNVFSPLFRYAKKKEKEGILTFETILSANLKS